MVKEEEIDIMIVEDLLCRFIVNLPKEEQTTDRLFFHIQAAHWFYSDFYVNNAEIIKAGYRVPFCNFKVFSKVIFKHCPFLKVYFEYFEIFFQRFSKYMSQIPVFGAIILNASLDKILLVTNYRNTSYSFPKGKINQNESGIECAVREVWEETGINISKYISEKDFIEYKMGGNKAQKMYVVCGIEENSLLKTTTRYEIGRIEWVPLTEIEDGKEASLFLRILPFIRPLKLWIRDYASARLKSQSSVQQETITMPPAGLVKAASVEDESFIKFKNKLSELGRELETRLQQESTDDDDEVEKDGQNPFLTFKLNTASLKAAFA